MSEEPLADIDGSAPAPVYARPGSVAFLKISAGVFLAGFSAFSLMYCVQPLLPLFAADFGISPARSALALSSTAGVLAIAVVVMAAVAVGFKRRTLMFVSMLAAALLTLAQAFAPTWEMLLALRAVEGLAIAGVPTVVLAYLAEEIDPRGVGFSIGLYISGNAIGGLVGRLGVSAIADAASWRTSMAFMGVLTLVFSIAFFLLMPPSRNFTPHRGASLAYHWTAWTGHLGRPAIRRLLVLGFVAMGTNVCVYNYVGFRLSLPPYSMSQAQTGLIFLVYIFGIVASPIAGAAYDRFGRPWVATTGLAMMAAGAVITLSPALPLIVLGIGVLTVGFFVLQPVLSSWPGEAAPSSKGHATSIYLLAWYSGAAAVGVIGGHAYSSGGWPGLVGLVLAMSAAATAALWLPGGGLIRR